MKTVFVDVDTQFDFILPAGALYAPGAEKILPLVSALNQYAGANGIPLISTVDAHTENEAEFRHWHPHCVAGTLSQQKPASTLLGKRAVNERAAGVQQIIVEKRSYDPFTNPKFAAILDELGGERCVVYGLVTDICVKYAAEGLLKTGRRVELVEDAVCAIDEAAARAFRERFVAGGGVVTNAAAVIG